VHREIKRNLARANLSRPCEAGHGADLHHKNSGGQEVRERRTMSSHGFRHVAARNTHQRIGEKEAGK